MKPLILTILFCLLASYANSQILTGKVISIADGDTITILDSNYRQTKIRLYGIDTPEKRQAYGKAAKKFTSELAYKQHAKVKVYDIDKYGRSVGVVFVGNTNVNNEIIKAGYGWQYRKYCKASFCDQWLQLEREARNAKMGLWRDKIPVPPWEWRKGKRNSGSKKAPTGRYEATEGLFHGNVKSHVFHSSSCQHYNCKNCIQEFSSRSAAISAGYRPCGGCRP